MLADLAKYTGDIYVFDTGSYVFPIEFEHPNDKNCYTYTNFPALNTTASFPDPETFLGSGETTALENSIRLLKDVLNSNTSTDSDFQTAVKGATYIVIPFMQSVDAMGQIINVGNQVLQANQEKAQNIFLSILEIIGLVAISFIPDIGPALSAAIGIGISAAEGDTNPLDYFIDAVGGISDIGKLVDDTAKTLDAAASKVDELLGKNSQTFDVLKDYKPFNDFENVIEDADKSSIKLDEMCG
jgi:hypothetical protein